MCVQEELVPICRHYSATSFVLLRPLVPRSLRLPPALSSLPPASHCCWRFSCSRGPGFVGGRPIVLGPGTVGARNPFLTNELLPIHPSPRRVRTSALKSGPMDRKKTRTGLDRTELQPDHRLRLHQFGISPGCGWSHLVNFLQPQKNWSQLVEPRTAYIRCSLPIYHIM